MRGLKMELWVVLVMCMCAMGSTGGKGVQRNLYHHLFSQYNKALRPSSSPNSVLIVEIGVELTHLIDMNEKHQTLTANLWLTMGWNDTHLQWNSSEWTGITTLTVPDGYVWKPDIVLYEKSSNHYLWYCLFFVLVPVNIRLHTEWKNLDTYHYPLPEILRFGVDQYFKGWSKSETYVKLHHSGYVLWEIPAVTLSSCQVNVSSFPFDRQKCPLKFGPWIHSGHEVEMKSMAEEGSLQSFMINAEWDVLSFNAETHMLSYGEAFDLGTPYSDVTFVLEFQRKSTFYVFNLLLPCLLLTFLMSTMFYLPLETGEKLSFGVSILLAIVVFQLVLNEVLPESEDLPWIGRYVILSMIMMSVSLSLSVLVMNVCDCSITVKPMPTWARRLFLQVLAQIMFMGNLSNNRPATLQNDETETFQMDLHCVNSLVERPKIPLATPDQSEYQAGVKNMVSSLKGIERNHSFLVNYMKERDRKEELRKEWRTMAKVLDRLFFFIYLVTSAVCLVAFGWKTVVAYL